MFWINLLFRQAKVLQNHTNLRKMSLRATWMLAWHPIWESDVAVFTISSIHGSSNERILYKCWLFQLAMFDCQRVLLLFDWDGRMDGGWWVFIIVPENLLNCNWGIGYRDTDSRTRGPTMKFSIQQFGDVSPIQDFMEGLAASDSQYQSTWKEKIIYCQRIIFCTWTNTI